MTGVIKVDDIQDAGANSIVSSNGSGTLTLGSFTAPNITASTAILPDASDGAAIGSASLEWSDLFLADGAVINFGDDQEVTLTHVADTGLLISSTDKLMFNDASQFIQGTSATVLDIAATDEIELTATLIDVVGNLAVSGTLAQADAITMATNKKIIFRDAAIHISSTADGDLSIAADDEIDITSTLIDINGNVEISGTAVTTGVHTFTAVPVFPNNTIETADIQADAIDGTKIADDAINSEHYTDGSIDTAHIAADQITNAKIADDQIDSEHYVDGSIDTAHIADGQVTTAKLATAVFTGATDIGAAIADADLILLDDGAGGTIRKSAASRLKTYIGKNAPLFQVRKTSDQNINHNTQTLITWDSADLDTGSVFDLSNNKFVCVTAGMYQMGLWLYHYDSDNDMVRSDARLFKNDTLFANWTEDVGSDQDNRGVWVGGSWVMNLSVDDVLEVYGYASTSDSGAVSIEGSSSILLTQWSGYRLVQ